MPQLFTALAAAALLLAGPAGAHTAGETAWSASWTLTPLIVITTVLVLWLYARGAREASVWQRVGFVSGSALLFIALQSPLDTLADDSFAVHQLQHLAIHALAPMLIALSAPAAPLIAGMPHALRRGLLPIASIGAVRATFAFLASPIIATAHFIAALLFWLQPGIQESALQDGLIHDAMHSSMLLAGLFFYFSVFDPRPPPAGSGYGARVFALLAALLVNIPLGAYLSYKETLLYPAYGAGARIGLEPLVDERVGGLIQYVPGSMMFVIAVLLVLGAWRRRDVRLQGWRARGLARGDSEVATTEPKELARRNARLGLTLAGICAFMFAAAIVGGILAHRAH